MKKNKVVYLHIKLDTGEPFYVGKGSLERSKVVGKGRSSAWYNIVNKHGFDIIILEQDLTEVESFEKEIYWIDRIGRRDLKLGPLVNHTNGGEGISGHVFSKESKEKISKANKGKTHSEEAKKKMSESRRGNKFSLKHRENLSKAAMGKKASEETRKKRSENQKGRKLSEGTKKKISNAQKGRVLSDEHRQKLLLARRKRLTIKKEIQND